MDVDGQAVSEPTAQMARSEVKKCKHVPIIVVLAILAVCGFAFGGFELWQNMRKEEEISKLQSEKMKNDESIYSYTDGKGNESGDENSDKNGDILIEIIANLDSVELEKCENDICSSGSGYVVGVADSSLSLLPNRISFSRHDGLFSGRAFQDNIEKEFEFSGEIKQVIVGKFGNGGDEAILILRKDGTVGAIRLDDKYENFIDIQVINGVSDVNALYQGYRDNGDEVFAVHSDGSYDTLYDKIWKK